MEHRANLMRLLGGLIWVMIPVVSLMLFLPHEIYINYEAALLLLFLTLLLNLAITAIGRNAPQKAMMSTPNTANPAEQNSNAAG